VDEVSGVEVLRLETLIVCNVILHDFQHSELQVQFTDGCIVFDDVSPVGEGMDCRQEVEVV
jgi:hypothetical protein